MSLRDRRKLGPEAPVLSQDGHRFRDLNKNGRLDPYEDSRLPVEDRVEDLLSQMTLEEKAGTMFHMMVGVRKDGGLAEHLNPRSFSFVSTTRLVARKHVNHVNVYWVPGPRQLAEWNNRLQKLAERTRLGIPATISSDPRHSCKRDSAASMAAESFSGWPEPIGLGAAGDEELVRRFGEIARQEYLAVGIRTALHPMADLATEPRWGRIPGTFGEDAELAARLTAAYIRGFQGEELGPGSVACMTKHFPGGGPQKDGEDPHFSYGKEQVYPGGNLEYHLIPFRAAFEAGTCMIMPYYGQPIGLEGIEEVGFGFNKDVITGLLRERFGFDGVVCTDWGLISNVRVFGYKLFDARAWGTEKLTREERILKALDARVDQFGGEQCPELVVKLVRQGRLSEERIDRSVRRLLRDKFRLGLFDDPYVDADAAERTVGKAEFREAGEEAQRRAITLLKNGAGEEPLLPLRGRPRVFCEGVDATVATDYCEVVSSPDQAELAIMRLDAPFQPRKGILERLFHTGDLDFKDERRRQILATLGRLPTVVDIFLDRPAVIPEIAERSAALLADFGASDRALLDVVFGRAEPRGRLPFELPSSMAEVRRQKSDLPADSERPLFELGHGLRYAQEETPAQG
ncbi:MAG: glycoside hydrolase family 3 N-terminal domain-containing protein [Gaiellaceae bacterium]